MTACVVFFILLSFFLGSACELLYRKEGITQHADSVKDGLCLYRVMYVCMYACMCCMCCMMHVLSVSGFEHGVCINVCLYCLCGVCMYVCMYVYMYVCMC